MKSRKCNNNQKSMQFSTKIDDNKLEFIYTVRRTTCSVLVTILLICYTLLFKIPQYILQFE